MRYQSYVPPGLWQRTRWIRFAFLAGLVLGVLLGWLFHGVISLFMQFGLVAILLLPLLVIGFLWWRASRRPRGERGPVQVMTWSNGPPWRQPTAPPADVADVVDVTDARDAAFTTAERRPRPSSADVEAELAALRAERDRARGDGRR